MKRVRLLATVLTFLIVGTVSDSIRKSLDQADLKDVSVSQDRDKGVITLGGHVPSDSGKS